MKRDTMLHRISIFVQLKRNTLVRFALSVLFGFSLGCFSAPTFAQERGQWTFASAEDASRALFDAMHVQDEQPLLRILGPAAKDILSSGDPTEDSDARAGFVVKYQEMHRFVMEANGTVTLIVGAENWPCPIPLVNNHGSWYFNTPAGKDKILFRRIVTNKLASMDACPELVKAENQYFAHPPVDLPTKFRKNLVCDETQQHGLSSQRA